MNRHRYEVWDKANNAWWKPVYRAVYGELHDLSLTPGGQVMERTLTRPADITNSDKWQVVPFTGVKDLAMRDILEGHVVRDAADVLMEPYVVMWSPERAGWYMTNGKYYRDFNVTYGDGETYMDTTVVIIGHILEKPDMVDLKGRRVFA